MASPGGYQLIGRTLPIWNSYCRAGPFEAGHPWLLRNFDQLRFHLVSEEELETQRADFANGRLALRIEDAEFDVAEHAALVASAAGEVAEIKARQRKAAEEQNRIDAEQLARLDSKAAAGGGEDQGMGAGGGGDPYAERDGAAVRAAVTGTVWELRAAVGQMVAAGETLLVLEAMKMEYAVVAPVAGRVADICVAQGDMVQQGASLCLVEAA
jgi:urea carboxylase